MWVWPCGTGLSEPCLSHLPWCLPGSGVLSMRGFHFLCLISIPWCVCVPFIRYFHFLAIVKNPTINMECVTSLTSFFRYIPSSGISRDHLVVLFLIYLRSFHTVFHNGYSNLHSTNNARAIFHFKEIPKDLKGLTRLIGWRKSHSCRERDF
jgi:hypothetical protein